MPLSEFQKTLVVKGLKKYKRKIERMKTHLSEAKDVAITEYKNKLKPKSELASAYEDAWADIPGNYSAAVGTKEFYAKWVRKFALKVWGVTLTDTEVESILREAGIT